jgi:hypothetical protein
MRVSKLICSMVATGALAAMAMTAPVFMAPATAAVGGTECAISGAGLGADGTVGARCEYVASQPLHLYVVASPNEWRAYVDVDRNGRFNDGDTLIADGSVFNKGAVGTLAISGSPIVSVEVLNGCSPAGGCGWAGVILAT